MKKVIAICNQKGGVAKTTTTVNLGIGLVKEGYKVLIVDADPQGNTTQALGYYDFEYSLAEGLNLAMSSDNTENLDVSAQFILSHEEGVDLIPANITLAATEAALVTAMSRETTLKRFLYDFIGIEEYDYVIIDGLPSLTMLMQNILVAADDVIIPIQPEYFASLGLVQLIETIKRIKRRINPKLSIAGILFTIVESKFMLNREIIESVSEVFGDNIRIFDTQIPKSAHVAKAPPKGISVYKYAPKCKGSIAYKKFTKEVIDNV
ncbi:MAG: ParA family protein [Saccharofermentans sp.]|nr:ParA family protein [Saccharofermentans sp.]